MTNQTDTMRAAFEVWWPEHRQSSPSEVWQAACAWQASRIDADAGAVEPMAYWWNDLQGSSPVRNIAFNPPGYVPTESLNPLYTAPPVAAPVGVTDAAIDSVANDHFMDFNNLTRHQWRSFARSILALAKRGEKK